MANVQFTVGEAWAKRFFLGMEMVRRLAHYQLPPIFGSTLDVATAVASLNNLARGRFQHDEYAVANEAQPPQPLVQVPQIDISKRYLLLTVNALTAMGEFVSSPTGGICFEDPFWAVLSAMSLAQKKLTVLPKANDNDQLWRNSSIVSEAVRDGKYEASSFFQEIKGLIPPAEFPKFETMVVGGEQLVALRVRGAQALAGTTPPRFYELFRAPRK